MPAEDRAISDFPIALQLLNTALVLISNPDGQGGYDSYQATLTELGRVILETQYTQDLGNVDVFNAIKNCRTLSGTTTPTSATGTDGQLYVKYQTVSNVTSVTGLFVKLSGSWCEISTGGGGDVGIECTQAQYDAWEQGGTLLSDTNYYITDGQSGGGVVIDDTTASLTTVYSSDKVEDLLDDKADKSSIEEIVKVEVVQLFSNVSISNNTEYNSNGSTVPHATIPSKAGYTPIAIVNVQAMGYYGSRILLYAWIETSDSKIHFSAFNTMENFQYTPTVHGYAWVMYIKSSLL